MLLTLVDPHAGHEVAYNRWYERDHFYSGLHDRSLAVRRQAVRRDGGPEEAARPGSSSAITGEPDRGSYVALYWVLDGHHDEWNLWAVDQVRALHKAGPDVRRARPRPHASVQASASRSAATRTRSRQSSPSITLTRAMVAMWVDAPAEARRDRRAELETRLREEHLPAVLAGATAGLVVGWEPLPLQVDVPGVARSDSLDRRLLLLWFLDASPAECFDRDDRKGTRKLIEDAGHGTVVAARCLSSRRSRAPTPTRTSSGTK